MTTLPLSNKFFSILTLIRFQNPTGTILLFIPCAIGTGLYGSVYKDYKLLLLFFLGSFIMRSAGCVINDIFDRNIDKNVERTKNRPIASGKITVTEAIIVFIMLSFFGLLILFQLAIGAIYLGLIAAILLVLYPLMKRITFWPQLFLGITYNIGVPIAAYSVDHNLSACTLISYIGCIFWTLYYDTIYAFMDLKDDKKIGVKSLARFLEDRNYKLWLSCFAMLALILISISLLLTNHNKTLVAVSFLTSLAIIMWQIAHLKINLSSNCLIIFKSNNYLGIIWALTSLI